MGCEVWDVALSLSLSRSLSLSLPPSLPPPTHPPPCLPSRQPVDHPHLLASHQECTPSLAPFARQRSPIRHAAWFPLCSRQTVLYVPYSLPSEEGTPCTVLRTLTLEPEPESGPGCLTCAIFARQRLGPNSAPRRGARSTAFGTKQHPLAGSGTKARAQLLFVVAWFHAVVQERRGNTLKKIQDVNPREYGLDCLMFKEGTP